MKLETCSATRNPIMPGRRPGDAHTEFQLHKSQLLSGGGRRNVFDYTEFRLKMYIEQVTDLQQKEMLSKVLKDYRLGKVAVAWKSGKPVWLAVTKETTKG